MSCLPCASCHAPMCTGTKLALGQLWQPAADTVSQGSDLACRRGRPSFGVWCLGRWVDRAILGSLTTSVKLCRPGSCRTSRCSHSHNWSGRHVATTARILAALLYESCIACTCMLASIEWHRREGVHVLVEPLSGLQPDALCSRMLQSTAECVAYAVRLMSKSSSPFTAAWAAMLIVALVIGAAVGGHTRQAVSYGAGRRLGAGVLP